MAIEDAIKVEAAVAAQRLVEAVWRETTDSYDMTPLMALTVAQKITNAVLSGAVKEHAEVLAQPFRPQQSRLSA
jgi:hypothetical protein